MQTQLSPISFLPNEILVQIFQHGIDLAPHGAHASPPPLILARVCRSWRVVVLGAPELWTYIFVTSATTIDHLQTYLERSGQFEINISFCHWPMSKDGGSEVVCNPGKVINLEPIVGALCSQAHRLRMLSLWNVSDVVVCTVMKSLLNIQTPRLTTVSVRANQTAYTHYYQLRNLYLLPFLGGGAPSLTSLDIVHFPIETRRVRSDWPFANVANLTSLTLRTQECPTIGFSLPAYLIEFPALCALLRATPNLVSLALHGPIIEPDEDFPVRPEGVTLSALETLIIHRRDPGVRYHCELLNVLTTPILKRLEIPWHDDLSVELPHADRTRAYLFEDNGGNGRPPKPRFGSVKELYIHNSAVEEQMPARSLIEAFPEVEEIVLGGTDVASFAEALRGSVRLRSAGLGYVPIGPSPDEEHDDGECADATIGGRYRCPPEYEFQSNPVLDELEDGGWQMVKRIVLKEPEMEATKWKKWVNGFGKWLAAEGHAGKVCIEIRDTELSGKNRKSDHRDGRGSMKPFERCLDRLRAHAQVVVV